MLAAHGENETEAKHSNIMVLTIIDPDYGFCQATVPLGNESISIRLAAQTAQKMWTQRTM